jgi:hypothetical protein
MNGNLRIRIHNTCFPTRVENPPANPVHQVENGVQRVLNVGAHVNSCSTVTYHKHALDLEDEW